MSEGWIRTGAILTAAIVCPTLVWAHGGNPAVAFFNEPVGVGIVVDDTFTFTWRDADIPIPTGTATVDFFYTVNRPMTFTPGDIPDDLAGTPIVTGLRERDLDNRYVWNVSDVPTGSYHLWSRVNEPPSEDMSIQIIDFAPGIVTVVQPGDSVPPALLVTSPRNAFEFTDAQYEITYEAFDPDGTGRVRLEAAMVPTSSNAPAFIPLADDLPADAEGRWTWNTSALPDGDWMIRATLTDARGQSFTTYSRFLLLISHPFSRFDAGTSAQDAGPPDAGSTGVGEDGCRCITSSREGWPELTGWWLGLGLFAAVRLRRSV
ncbi:MAG: hypothetical protein AAFN74_03560 [Myxococcota bacterium]